MRKLVIIPTYNELENIQSLVPAIMSIKDEKLNVLVVDDNSPDGTGKKVSEMQKSYPKLNILNRPGKQGLGRAYVAGFKWGLANSYDILIEMDADFSHRPADLVKILAAAESGNDFVIGSRYVPSGETVNWGFMRKLISRGGSWYSRCILGYPIRDWTGGFNAWSAKVLQKIDVDQILSNGYSFQIELKYKASRAGFKGVEVPIVFEDRRVGQSKMSLRIVLEAFYRVWMIRCN